MLKMCGIRHSFPIENSYLNDDDINDFEKSHMSFIRQNRIMLSITSNVFSRWKLEQLSNSVSRFHWEWCCWALFVCRLSSWIDEMFAGCAMVEKMFLPITPKYPNGFQKGAVCFAMTICNARDQTLAHCGVDLESICLSHGRIPRRVF